MPHPIATCVKVMDKHTLLGHADEVSALAFSPDSIQLASGSEDKTVRLWDPSCGQLRNIFTGHTGKVRRRWDARESLQTPPCILHAAANTYMHPHVLLPCIRSNHAM